MRPHVWLRYDPAGGTLADTRLLPPFPRDLSGYESVETTARAPDGTEIPLSIITRKGLARDGRRPTYLVGYGAYGISYDPAFSPTFLPWLDRGGVYAVAHVRGGGERGQAWHDAGKIATKQNTIHDFIAAAETLIARGYTDKAHLGGEGTSAGGILIGGAITQRPDLFRAALIRVGATNTLREQYTRGRPGQHPGVRRRHASGSVSGDAGDGCVQPRSQGGGLSSRAAHRRRRRPAGDGVDPGQDDGEAAGGHPRPGGRCCSGSSSTRGTASAPRAGSARRRDGGRVRVPCCGSSARRGSQPR